MNRLIILYVSFGSLKKAGLLRPATPKNQLKTIYLVLPFGNISQSEVEKSRTFTPCYPKKPIENNLSFYYPLVIFSNQKLKKAGLLRPAPQKTN